MGQQLRKNVKRKALKRRIKRLRTGGNKRAQAKASEAKD